MTYTVRLKGGGKIHTDGMLAYRHVFTHYYGGEDTIVGITLQDEGKRMYIPIACIKEIIEDGDTVWRTNR